MKRREREFRLIRKLREINEEFDIEENLNYYGPYDLLRARQTYILYRWNKRLKKP